MTRYRDALPQLSGGRFFTDGGLETTLMFRQGRDLPCLAAFTLLADEVGERTLRAYFDRYLAIAEEHGGGFVLESPTWRASPDWGREIGYTPEELAAANRRAVEMLIEIRDARAGVAPIVVSGCLGPRGDGYDPGTRMSVDDAREYHSEQITALRDAGADMITAQTLNYVEEAIGIALAAADAGMPVVISFTVETDGCLPTGQPLREAIEDVDAATDSGPAYYMINCAHPTHFSGVLVEGEAWVNRIRGLRANASKRSHAELDDSVELDAGDPREFGEEHRALLERFPHINVLGGCCGTDDRHVAAAGAACAALE